MFSQQLNGRSCALTTSVSATPLTAKTPAGIFLKPSKQETLKVYTVPNSWHISHELHEFYETLLLMKRISCAV